MTENLSVCNVSQLMHEQVCSLVTSKNVATSILIMVNCLIDS